MIAAVLVCPAPASAEIYRWRDESGREHFTTDIQQVPPRYRKATSEWKPRDDGANRVNIHESVPPPSAPAPRSRPLEAEPQGPPKAERACDRDRRAARKLLRRIETKERSVEHLDDLATDVGRSVYSQRRYEIKRDRAQAELDALEAEYEAFRERRRRAGVDPGCLR